MHNIAIGRQAIYDARLQLIGYELLFREYGKQNQADFSDGNQATTEVILNTLTEIGTRTLLGDAAAFFNLTEQFLSGEIPLPEMPKNVTLEILEDIPATEANIAGIRRFIAKGYTIALDDFVYNPSLEPFVELAHIIKLDIMAQDREAISNAVNRFKEQRKKILAEKVETYEDFEFCKSLGFDYYQGYFFCKPEVITARTLPVNKLQVVQLLAKLHDPACSAVGLEAEISTDLALSYRLLRYINSVQYYLQKDIDSIKQAILLLGWDNIRSIASLLIMSKISDKPLELFKTGLVRAKMCEIIGGHLQPMAKEIFFTAGLLSILDALVDMHMEDVMAQLPLSHELSAALIHHEGVIGSVLNVVSNYLQQAIIVENDLISDPEIFTQAFLLSIQWADSTLSKLDRVGQSA